MSEGDIARTDRSVRVTIAAVRPELSGGRYPVKRVVGDSLRIAADVLKEGHELPAAEARVRRAGRRRWTAHPMTYSYDEDEWSVEVPLPEVGRFEYTVAAWTDRFASWSDELRRKHESGEDVSAVLAEGVGLLHAIAAKAPDDIGPSISVASAEIEASADDASAVAHALEPGLAAAVARAQPRPDLTIYDRRLPVVVDRELARFGAWYEMFPRSQGKIPGKASGFREAAERLPAIAAMGFDVVYLPPIHPIGETNRKGRNNQLRARADDPGSPWAIGNSSGGHDAIDPGLGTFEDFDAFVARAQELGLEVALDYAIQCSPDHPYTRDHPEWFRRRPDGSIKYAENPPKKYEDIVALDMWCEDYRALWAELLRVLLSWVDRGVRVFRVDNPHTKPITFWAWLIDAVKREHPDVILLSEAFTRPKKLQELAKIGFSQSYTYFTWRNTREELETYLTELTTTERAEYLRPNFFVNTPDILHEYLQKGGRPAFKTRLALAATLSPSYGIYSGFELIENTPVREGSEEYLDSEKFEIRVRDWQAEGNISHYITAVNAIRRQNPALRLFTNVSFHSADNPMVLSYSKATQDGENRIVVVANLDPHSVQSATIRLDPQALAIEATSAYVMHDLLTGQKYPWRGLAGWVRLDPATEPVHIFRVEEA